MRQSIEKQRETKSPEVAVTVMFRDRKGFFGVGESSCSRSNFAPSLLDGLKVVDAVVSPVPSLPSHLKVSAFREHSRHRTRRRTTPSIIKFPAEEPVALSALAVSSVNPNKRGTQAAKNETTTMTEQRRCRAA